MNAVYLTVGLAYGDEGKGATVDVLVRKHGARLVVRYNGGPQAGHNVVASDGKHHTFAQFGSGMFVPGVLTHLSQYMLVDPISMMNEEDHLVSLGITDAWVRTTVDHRCVIVTPFHKAVNRIVEWSRGEDAHGSCGMGVGEARRDHLQYGSEVLLAGDLKDERLTKHKLRFLQSKAREKVATLTSFSGDSRLFPTIEVLQADGMADALWDLIYRVWPVAIAGDNFLAGMLEHTAATVFEGAQGVLLDERRGTAPYRTWTDCTLGNAQKLLQEANFAGQVHRVGVLRTYFTRHGPGPFMTENSSLSQLYPEPHNDDRGFQGKFRVGIFDVPSVEYSLRCIGGVDEIHMNHLDYLERSGKDHIAVHVGGFQPIYLMAHEYVPELARRLEVPITVVSAGPTAQHRMAYHGNAVHV